MERANDKRCRKCKQVKAIGAFTLPRHRLCTACRTLNSVDLAEQFIARQQGDMHVKPLTTTWEGYKKYQRDRARRAAADKEREAAARGVPARKVTYSRIKLCVRCGAIKPSSAFHHPRYRVCMACDGPTTSV